MKVPLSIVGTYLYNFYKHLAELQWIVADAITENNGRKFR